MLVCALAIVMTGLFSMHAQPDRADGICRCHCGNHLCWLCGSMLSKHNPYSHYDEAGPCRGRTYA